MKQTKTPSSHQRAAGQSIQGVGAAFSGDTLLLSLPQAPDGPLELLLAPPGGVEGPRLPLIFQGETCYAEGLHEALSALSIAEETDFEMLISSPRGRFYLENRKAAGENKALQKGLLTWAEGSIGSLALPFSVYKGERTIVEKALPYLSLDKERPLYPVTYLTKEGRLFLSLATERSFYQKACLCSLKGLSLFGKHLRLKVNTSLPAEDASLALFYETSDEEKSAAIYFRERPQEEKAEELPEEQGEEESLKEAPKGEDEREEPSPETAPPREHKGFFTLQEKLALSGAPLKRSSWIAALLMPTKDGEEIALPIQMSYRQRFFYNYLYKGRYRRKGRFLYPANTDEGTLTFQYRPIEKEDRLPFHVKELLALVLYHLKKRSYDKQNIQLIYERNSQAAHDNAYFYFKHCLENGEEDKKDTKFYYVIGEKSLDLPRLAPYMDHVIYFKSLRHMQYLLAAKVLVTTHTRFHAYPRKSRGSLLLHYLRKKPVVFLQHGVTGLKNVDAVYGKTAPGAADLFVAASEKEKQLVKEHLGYKESEIVVAGLPRFDVISGQSEGKRDILIMPTWRSWMDALSPAEFYQSTYYRSYMSLLNSCRLSRLLEEEALTVSFYLHPRFRMYIHSFAAISPRVRFIPYGEEEVSDLIMGCKLLITDYSSVCWDVLYLGKPVLFFQFDRPHYLLENGSYLDMATELPGECAFTASDMVMLLKDYAQNGFCLKEPYASLQKEYFPAPDQENTRRVLEAICERWHLDAKKGAMFCPRSRRGEATKQASGPDQYSKNFVLEEEKKNDRQAKRTSRTPPGGGSNLPGPPASLCHGRRKHDWGSSK